MVAKVKMGKPSRAGSFNAEVRFERQGDQSNVGGVVRANWGPLLGPVWGELKPIRGGEEALAGRLAGVERFELKVRGSPDVARITTDDRAVDHREPQRIFAILNILDPDQRGRELVFLLERGKANG